MANGYVGGTVTARVKLDTSEVKSAVASAKESLGVLKNATLGLNKVNLNTYRANLSKISKTLSEVNINLNTYKSNIAKVNQELAKQKPLNKQFQTMSQLLDKQARTTKKQATYTEELASAQHRVYGKSAVNNLNTYKSKLSEINNVLFKAKTNLNQYKANMVAVNATLQKQVGKTVQPTGNLNTYKANMSKINQELAKQLPNLNKELNLRRSIGSVLNRQSQATAKLAAEQHRVYARNHTQNINTYKANLTSITREVTKQITQLNKASVEWSKYRNSMRFNYSQYISQITNINRALNAQWNRTQQLASAQHRLYGKYNTTNLNTYKSNMNQINSALQTQVNTQNKSAKATSKTASSFKKLGTQANYVNKNLWKLRGIILGVRTIFLSFGGIYVWQFFEEMIRTTKETLAVKSEMEQFLKMNEKLGKHGGGIEVFNKGLDKTIQKFKKLNKYTLGETVASIGKEFNLSAREMTESMDVIAMVQSEYVRAGRKESEAALAVKDILQGEFRRLSMETGVGEKELKALGWSGDKKDVIGMMEAIRKAGTARHWDDFAKKATSLTDVFNILKNRMAEFGAEIADAVTPMIVGAFNTMADAFDFLKGKYNGLSTGMKVGINFAAIMGGFTGLSAIILKLWKGFGLVDVAAVGFKKSMLSAVLGLDLATVRTKGFGNALVGVITKSNATSVAEMGMTKSLGAWVLGLDAAIVKDKGFLTALAAHNYELMNTGKKLNLASASTLKWYQKLVIAKKGVDTTTASNYGLAKSLRTLVFNFNLLKKAAMITTLLVVAKQFIGLSMYMDKAKKSVEGFYNVVDDGKNLLSDANKELETQKNRVSDLNKKIGEYKKQKKDTTLLEQQYNQALSNQAQAQANVNDITTATKRAAAAQKNLNEMMSTINLDHQRSLADIYKHTGMNAQEATVQASKYNQTVTEGYKQETLAYHMYDKRLDSGVKHMQEHIGFLKQSGASSKDLVKYAEDYDAILQETSNHWKKFWEGDMWSGASAILGELKLAFIDLSYNPHFIKLTKELTATWKAWQPTLLALKDSLGDLLNKAMDLVANFLSTDIGKTTALWTGLGLAVGGVAYKMRGVVSKGKSVLDFFTTLGSTLKDVINKFRRYKKVSGEVPTPTDTTTTTTTTPTTVPGGVEKGKFWETVGQDARNVGRSFLKASMYLASAMLLASEAILLLNAPMGALAATGWTFKKLEPNIRKGIDGLKLIAPVVAIILPPVVALMVIMEKFADAINPATAAKAFGASAAGIAGALLLVAEAIIMLSVPLASIAALGYIRSQLNEGNIQQGMASIQLVGESLKLLVPFIPIFALGIGLIGAAIATEGIGIVITLAVVGGIALGLGILAESILALAIPLKAIEQLGSLKVNLEGVRKGSEMIRVTGEALKSVASAVGSMGSIIWDEIKLKIGEFITGSSVIDEITKEDGLIDKVVDFNKKFNAKIGGFEEIKTDLVTKFAQSADGIKQIGDAINKLTTAMNGVQIQGGGNLLASVFTEGDEIASQAVSYDSSSVESYLNTVEGIINDVSKFNASIKAKAESFVAPPTELIGGINNSVTFITSVKSAVDKLQGTMQSALGGQLANAASTGMSLLANPLGTASNLISNAFGGGGGYKSSIGGSLQSLEDIISDLVTFNNRVNGMNIGASGNVDGLVSFVNAVQGAITKVQSILNSSTSQLQSQSHVLGTAIVTGFQQGIQGLQNVKIIDLITAPINQGRNAVLTLMGSLGKDATTHFSENIKGMSDAMKGEMGEIGREIDSGRTANGSKAYGLGQYLVSQFKAGAGIASPGDIAKAMVAEIGYVADAIQTGINTLPYNVQNLATAMVNQFDPRFNTDFLNFTQNTEGLKLFNTSMSEVKSTSEDTLASTDTTFTQMKTTVNSTFDNISSNATQKYTQLQTTTKTSLKTMQNQTTRSIGAIKTSWNGMQKALIASAENIRNQTSEKISRLEHNMASFWRKVRNPALLLGGAGSPTIRPRVNPTRSVGVKRSVGSRLKGNFAGSPPKRSSSSGGSSNGFKIPFTKGSSTKDLSMRKAFEEYLTILFNGQTPYAGWNFDWSKNIQDSLMQWNTHFPKPFEGINQFLKVGSFDNSDFPVKGNAGFAKKYIYDAIKQTRYSFYFNSRHGNNPLSIWNAGAFNCWDGAHLVMALASALGFPGGSIVHGTWNGIRHVWARIPGLGDIDSTAIQQRGTFTAPSVVRAAGSPPSAGRGDGFGSTNNYNVEVHVHVDGNADEQVIKRAGEVAGKRVIDILKPSMATGR